jgi:hypothetical protein
MLILSSVLILAFIIHTLSSDVDDDDNGPDSGLMQPVYAPTS